MSEIQAVRLARTLLVVAIVLSVFDNFAVFNSYDLLILGLVVWAWILARKSTDG